MKNKSDHVFLQNEFRRLFHLQLQLQCHLMEPHEPGDYKEMLTKWQQAGDIAHDDN